MDQPCLCLLYLNNLFVLEEILQLLENPALPVPHKHQMKKTLKYLKVLVEALPEVEERANKIILSLRYGNARKRQTFASARFPMALRGEPIWHSSEAGMPFKETIPQQNGTEFHSMISLSHYRKGCGGSPRQSNPHPPGVFSHF